MFQLNELCFLKWCPVHRGMEENSNYWKLRIGLAPFYDEIN